MRRRGKNLASRAFSLLKFWRVIVAFIIFVVLVPTFLATHDNDNFALIVLSITAGVIALAYIVSRALNNRLKRYIRLSIIFLVVGALLLSAALLLPGSSLSPGALSTLKTMLLVASAFAYALGGQRLGLGILVGGI